MAPPQFALTANAPSGDVKGIARSAPATVSPRPIQRMNLTRCHFEKLAAIAWVGPKAFTRPLATRKKATSQWSTHPVVVIQSVNILDSYHETSVSSVAPRL